jgi:hypothetical protein
MNTVSVFEDFVDVCTEMPPQKVIKKSRRVIDPSNSDFRTFHNSSKWLNIEQVKDSFDELYLKLKNENNL